MLRWVGRFGRSPLSRICQQARLFSDQSEKPVHKWLQAKGYTEAGIIRGIVNAFGGNPSISDLSSLGDAGLKAVAEAVRRESPAQSTELDVITVHIALSHGEHTLDVQATEGESFYDLTLRNRDVAQHMECSCRGIAACSTCHVYVHPDFLAKLPPPEDAELDMLDLAWGHKENSRLGCQIKFSKELDGLQVELPSEVHDLFK